MKKIVCFIIIILMPTVLFAASNEQGTLFLGGYGGAGMVKPAGSNNVGADFAWSTGYLAGIDTGYLVVDSLAIIAGAEYASKPLKLERDDGSYTFKTRFINIYAGGRLFISNFYLDCSLYYGMMYDTPWDLEAR